MSNGSSSTNPKVTSKYFNNPSTSGNSGMDESLSEFKEEKKSSKGPKEVKIQRKLTQKPRKRIRGQKDIRTALKPKKNELLTYANDFDKVCRQSGIDIDSEQLQIAIALSKSLETENAEPSTSSQTRDRTVKIRKTLQEYGFKVPENKIIGKRRVKRYRKNCKLLLTSFEQKQQIISDRYSQVLFKNIERVTQTRDKSTKLDLFYLATEISYDLINNSNFFYIKNLIEQHPNSVGSLLKRWSLIPGRPKSPILKKTEVKFSELDITQNNLDVILSGTVNTTQETVQSLSKINPEEVNKLDTDICYKSVERTSFIDTKMNTDVIISLDEENCEELCSFEPVTEKLNPESIFKIDHVSQNQAIVMKNDQRCSSPDLFDDELSLVENGKENSVIVSQDIKITEASNNFMDLTDCVAAKSTLNIDQSQFISQQSQKNNFTKRKSNDFMEITDCVALNSQKSLSMNLNIEKSLFSSQKSQSNNLTKRKSNDFMEITDCVTGSSQPLLENIVEVNIDLTQTSDEHCQENIDIQTAPVKCTEIMDLTHDSKKTLSKKNTETANKDIESLDLTQSSNSEDDLPIVQISGRQVNKDGRQVNEDGTQVNKDGRQVNEDGTQVNKDGLQVNKDGLQVNKDGVQVNKNGRQVNEGGRQVNKESSLNDTIILNDDEYKCLNYAPRNNMLNFQDNSVDLVNESFTEDASNINKIYNSENFRSAVYEPNDTTSEKVLRTEKTKSKIISRDYLADCKVSGDYLADCKVSGDYLADCKVSGDYLADCKATKEKLQRISACKSKTESFFDKFDYTHSDEDLKRQSIDISKEHTTDSSSSKSSNLFDIDCIGKLDIETSSRDIVSDMDLTKSYTEVKISRKKILDIVNDIDLTQNSNDEEQYSHINKTKSIQVSCESPEVSCESLHVACESPQVSCKSSEVSNESLQVSYESLGKSESSHVSYDLTESYTEVKISRKKILDIVNDIDLTQSSNDDEQDYLDKSKGPQVSYESPRVSYDSPRVICENPQVSYEILSPQVVCVSSKVSCKSPQVSYKSPRVSYESLGKRNNLSIDYEEIFDDVIEQHSLDSKQNSFNSKSTIENEKIDICDIKKLERSNSIISSCSQNSEVFEISDNEFNYSINQSRYERPEENYEIPEENYEMSQENFEMPEKNYEMPENFDFGGISVMDDLSNARSSKSVRKSEENHDNFQRNDEKLNSDVNDSFLPIIDVGYSKNKLISTNNTCTKISSKANTAIETPSNTNTAIETPSNTKYVIKTDQVTPMLDFGSMTTPERNKELDRYGLKPFKRKRAIQLLTHLYNQTHPIVASCSEDMPSPSKKQKPNSLETFHEEPRKSPRKLLSKNSPKKISAQKSPRKCLSQNVLRKSPKKTVGISPIKFESRGESSTNSNDNFTCTENRLSHQKKVSPRKCLSQNLQQKSPKKKVGKSPIKSAKTGESTSDSDDNFLYTENRRNLPKSPRKKTAKSGENSPKSSDNFSWAETDDLYEVTNEKPVIKVIDCDEDDWVFQKREKAKVQSCRVPLHIAFHNYVSARPSLREAILRYEPINIDDIHKGLLANGLRFDPKDLLKFLDKKCVTVKTADNDCNKKTQ